MVYVQQRRLSQGMALKKRKCYELSNRFNLDYEVLADHDVLHDVLLDLIVRHIISHQLIEEPVVSITPMEF